MQYTAEDIAFRAMSEVRYNQNTLIENHWFMVEWDNYMRKQFGHFHYLSIFESDPMKFIMENDPFAEQKAFCEEIFQFIYDDHIKRNKCIICCLKATEENKLVEYEIHTFRERAILGVKFKGKMICETCVKDDLVTKAKEEIKTSQQMFQCYSCFNAKPLTALKSYEHSKFGLDRYCERCITLDKPATKRKRDDEYEALGGLTMLMSQQN